MCDMYPSGYMSGIGFLTRDYPTNRRNIMAFTRTDIITTDYIIRGTFDSIMAEYRTSSDAVCVAIQNAVDDVIYATTDQFNLNQINHAIALNDAINDV